MGSSRFTILQVLNAGSYNDPIKKSRVFQEKVNTRQSDPPQAAGTCGHGLHSIGAHHS
jgi:hypothetical protein